MADNTPRFDLGTYAQGDEDWSHTDTVETLDELAVDRGPIDDRPASGDYDDEFYYATDQRVLWRWDSGTSDWNAAAGLGSDSQRVPGTTYLDDLDATTLADTALDSEIDTAQLSDDAVTAAKIAAAAVDSGAIASGAVSVDELADALGTTSSSKVPGTTYFEESSHEALEADAANIGGTPAGISLDQSTFEDITEHTGQLVEVADGDMETIFSVSDPVDIIVGKINGERIGRVEVTWDDDTTDEIYLGSTQGRNANDRTFNTISIGSIKNVKELSFGSGSTNDYGWRVLTI